MQYIIRCFWSKLPDHIAKRRDLILTEYGYETLYGEDGVPTFFRDLNVAYANVAYWEDRGERGIEKIVPQHRVEEASL